MFLELNGVFKSYRSVNGVESRPVLEGLDLRLERGESVAVIGPSGSGKSTLLNIIGALDRPTSGAVSLGGQDIVKLDEQKLATLRNECLGFVFQAHHLLPQCTVLENVLVPTLVNAKHRNNKDTIERAKRLIERVGLKDRIDHRPGQLSGGEQQRVAVVRALINEPSLLLADEPTGALDQATADGLIELLVELNSEEGVGMIVVTHSMHLAKRMSRVMSLENGKLVEA